jgi:rhamnogalacturonyl hydrolase YesR
MLAAETLARIYSISKDENIKDYITKAVDFTIHHQLSDGSWNYSIDLKSGKERPQIDFHQGYVLESLYEIMKLTGENNPVYLTALKSGAEYYYSKQFTDEGRSLWRMPKQYPVDSHFQAQGIITFSLLKEIDERYFPFANKIAYWSINNMQDSSGYFYYQVHRFYKNKISYMRWCNAWMFLALSSLLKGIRK